MGEMMRLINVLKPSKENSTNLYGKSRLKIEPLIDEPTAAMVSYIGVIIFSRNEVEPSLVIQLFAGSASDESRIPSSSFAI
jgi:hypothetical protein